MNSKQRVEATINHVEPDRVPVGEWGIDHDHVSKIIGRHTYWRNRKDTTLALWDGRRDEVVESMKADYAELVDKLDYDIITVETVPAKGHKVADPPRKTGKGTWEDSKGDIYKYAASNDSISRITKHAGKEELTDEDVEKALKKIENIDDSVFELIDYFSDRYGDEKAILCRSIDIYTPLFQAFDGDFAHDLLLTLIAPDEIKRLYQVCYAYNQKVIDHCAGKNVMILMQGQDFGMNSGCIMSPDLIRDIFIPVMKEVNTRIVQKGMVPFYHCCGNIWDIMEDFVASGYKGYQSIQESASMDNSKVKQLYGDRLTMWTGVQCETLVGGTLEDIETEVNRNLKLLMPGGGYIFGSTNSVQYGAKTENYLRALDIVRKNGIYR
ncbi:MAG: uroporphyrinogen decarboxylase family protein [Clostridiaceae bacterium]